MLCRTPDHTVVPTWNFKSIHDRKEVLNKELMNRNRSIMKIDGHDIPITQKARPMFPDSGITKGDVVDYYKKIARYMLPYLKDRPLTLHRFPEGIGQEGFFQKNASDYFPNWIKTARIKKKDGWVDHVICDTAATLVYLANQGTLTFHIALSKIDQLEYPDKLVFDLDPPDGDFYVATEGAKIIRDLLEDKLGLPTFVMTTGSKGLHAVVPLKRTENFEKVREFAKKTVNYLANDNPDIFTTAIRHDKRNEKLYLDYLRNSYGQTGVCPFSIRAIEGAPVATPLSWDELADRKLSSQTYNIQNIFKRLEKKEDSWKKFIQQSKSIKNASVDLEKLMLKYASTEYR